MRLDRLTNKFQLAPLPMPSRSHSGHDNQFIEPHFNERLLNQEAIGTSFINLGGRECRNCALTSNRPLSRLPQVEGTGGDVQPSQDLVRILNLATSWQKKKDNFISSELFVLAALESRGTLTDL
ncbi:hypothetical protein MJ585_21095 [Klebsiella pneumoniae]|nr:hypothetical protein MJ585_21095 [Klebsiella pneumoniae]